MTRQAAIDDPSPRQGVAQALARWSHPVMFYLSLVFLGLVALLLVLWIEIPRVAEMDLAVAAGEAAVGLEDQALEMRVGIVPIDEAERAFIASAYRWGLVCVFLLAILWAIFIAEQIVQFRLAESVDAYREKYPYWWVGCCIPPLRMCARDRGGADDRIWFPRIGWQYVDLRLQRRLEKAFSVPMVWIALLILPVLGVPLVLKESLENYPLLRLLLNFATGFIWFAFAVEFIVMVSVSHKKLAYCKKHWLDLLIILLPLISFLRTLRILRATRLAKLGKVQQLSRVVRVYRLRGVSMRALRALLLLEVVHRLLRTKPEKRIAKLEELYLERQRELDLLREEIDQLRAMHLSENENG